MIIVKFVLCIVLMGSLNSTWTRVNAADVTSTKEAVTSAMSMSKPSSVKNLKAEVKGIKTVKLMWSAVGNADGYIIYRRIGNGKFTYRYMVSETTYTDTTAKTGEINFYRVYAYKNVNGKRVLSEAGNYDYAKPAPVAVTTLNAKATGINTVKLTWNKVADADGYIIYRRIGNGQFTYRYMVSGTTYTDTTAQTGEINFYRVYSYKNVNGKRVLSAAGNYKYAKPAIPAVVNLISAKQGNNIKVTWNNLNGVDGYIIYRQAPGEIKMTYRYMVHGTQFVDTDTSASGNYFYRVYPYKNVNSKRVLGASTKYVYTSMPKIIIKYEEGMYHVGVDIPAGEYIVMNKESIPAYYEVNKGQFNKDIINNGIVSYNDYVTVKDGQYITLQRAVMYPANQAPVLNTSGEGVFKVGKDIVAGQYRIVSTSNILAYYEISKDSNNSFTSIIENDNFIGSRIVTVSNGQYLKVNRAKIEKSK